MDIPAQGHVHLNRYHLQIQLRQQPPPWEQFLIHHPPIPPQQKVPHTFPHSLALHHSSGRFYITRMHPLHQKAEEEHKRREKSKYKLQNNKHHLAQECKPARKNQEARGGGLMEGENYLLLAS